MNDRAGCIDSDVADLLFADFERQASEIVQGFELEIQKRLRAGEPIEIACRAVAPRLRLELAAWVRRLALAGRTAEYETARRYLDKAAAQ